MARPYAAARRGRDRERRAGVSAGRFPNYDIDSQSTLYYKAHMRLVRRDVALVEILLVAPSALFMSALFLRDVQPALETGRLVDWYVHHFIVGLYVFLFGMPLAALFIGSTLLVRVWRGDLELRRGAGNAVALLRPHAAVLLIAAATLAAVGILAVVMLHMVTE